MEGEAKGLMARGERGQGKQGQCTRAESTSYDLTAGGTLARTDEILVTMEM